MGRGKGKKSRKEEKALAKKAKAKQPKLPGVPKLPNPAKIARKLAAKEKRAAAVEDNPPKYEPSAFPTPLGRHKPFTKQHAKWPALFKKHMGVLESHIRALDRIMMSMRADIDLVPAKERLDYELGERGNWRAICEMMDRARQTLCSAKEAAKGILPEKLLKDKKGLGVTGTTFERLGPQLMKKAAELGYDPRGKGKLGRDPDAVVDEDGDSEMSDASDSDSSSSSSDSEDDAESMQGGADFVPLKLNKKASMAPEAQESSDDESSEDETEGKPTTNQPDTSTMFFVDTEPTPVNLAAVQAESLSGNAKKRAKRAMLAAIREEKKANRHKAMEARLAAKAAKEAEKAKSKPEAESKPEPDSESTSNPEPEAAKAEPDFNALAAKLQADIEAKEKAKAEAEAKAKAEKKADKKRRRSSDGIEEVIEKKAKKERMEKKEQKGKKEKKRKAEETEISTTADEVAGGKKKKRKEA